MGRALRSQESYWWIAIAVAMLTGDLALPIALYAQVGEEFAPLVKIQQEDYAKARKNFHTRLLREGPSPQPWAPMTPPAGVSEVEYQSGELHLKAWVSHPTDETVKHPAVLFVHGGFAMELEDWDVSQPYRDAGYVVLTPLLRGENGQPGAYSFFYNEVDDALAAADYLSKLPYVDASQLFIAGPSAGGAVVLLTAQTSDRFRGAASFSASPDQVLFCQKAKNAANDVPINIKNQKELEMRSPLAYAESFKCPARLYYGSQEPPWKLTRQRTALLAKKHGQDVEAIEIEGDHTSSVKPGIMQSIEFFKKLGGKGS